MHHKRKAGRRKFKETRHPVYRGVRRRNGNKWVCEVRQPNNKSRIWLGTYPTPEMAATAHDSAVLSLRGSSALLNFPDSAPLLPLAPSSSPSDVRAAAAKAAAKNIMNNEEAGTMFVDEEALYNMPALLDSMAEGLLLTPPSMSRAFMEDTIAPYSRDLDLNLWTH
ncbi:dehydration-responsive element-binding protein 1F-like [Prosopis cineraria]|uniref:dehydration-responsive element-binding protein 1F-like n=1 Tax=Prosopis cineraria TaxID=364024 RepID=UPI002410A883|nr:dehydration-responsive element-binding protein 1F-like [Prosopis cineraria]